MAFSDIPIRQNGPKIMASWFNTIRTELINFEGSTISTADSSRPITSGEGCIVVDTTAGEIELTLPDPSTYPGKEIKIKKIIDNDNAVVVLPYNAETIDGDSSDEIQQYNQFRLYKNDGTNWYIF